MRTYLKMFICVGSGLILLPIFIIHICGVEVGTRSLTTQVAVTKSVDEDIIQEETLIGILAKEIPYTYEIEALKAQAIVERTYMARRILGIQKQGAIVGYTVDEMKTLWGDEKYEEIYNTYKEAVQATRKQLIMYENKPIEALYHEASSGRTRDAKSVYKQDIPYLKSVESKVDEISQQLSFKKEEMAKKLQEAYPNLVIEANILEQQMQVVEKDEAGYILALQIGNITMTGETLKTLLDLPSCAFKIYNSGDKIIFDIRGIGDGIGLSLNGANELAKQGMTYEEILHYYYTDVTIEEYEVQNG